MDLLSHLANGFAIAFTPLDLAAALAGGVLGTLLGVLPGVGSLAAIAMLLPAAYALQPVTALILLAGIHCGAQYGGCTAALLVDPPGVTAIDGYQMARQGRAGPALAAAGVGAFFAGAIATLVLALCVVPLAGLASRFGPAEEFSLMVLGLVGAAVLASGSLLKAIGMTVLGLLLGMVGTDVQSGVARLSFGVPALADGVGFITLAIGVFGYGEMIGNVGQGARRREVLMSGAPGAVPSEQEFRRIAPAVLRGTALGAVLGILPGGGALLCAFAAASLEKQTRLHPGEVPFGKGNIRAVAAPAAAGNAGAQAAFLPLLALGIPPNAVMALMLGALRLHHVQPGQVLASDPQLFWALIASMWIGNLVLVIINLPFAGLWARLLALPYRWLFPALVLSCAIGVYATHQDLLDICMVAVFGVAGYAFLQLGCDPAPLLLGFVLGPWMEQSLRSALALSRGDWDVLLTRPASASLLAAALALLIVVALPSMKAIRAEAFVED